jgi:hypothetical protein
MIFALHSVVVLAQGTGLALGLALAGCGAFRLTNLLNPDLLGTLGLGTRVASLPGDAPGLLVGVENRTDRWASIVISYRDGEDKVQSYTTVVKPGDKSAQMLVCPIKEMTLGDVSNLDSPGAVVYLIPEGTAVDADLLANSPVISVDPFGVLLMEGINYDCGDGVTFTVQPSGTSSSGYQTFAYIRRSGSS